jgi:hypothetical protein
MIGNGSISGVQFLGLATMDLVSGVNGVVTWFGYVRDLDTRGTANTAISVGDETWAVGDKLYVHPTAAGKLTNVEPEAPNVKICVASIIIRNQTVGVLFVRPTTNLNASDLSDVQITTPAVNQFLVWAGNRWQNANLDISVDTTPSLGGNLAGGIYNISTTGNITGNYFVGNGSQLTGLPAGYANSNVVAYGEAGWGGNIIPSANVTYSLGNVTNQWKSIYVGANTLYINNVAISVNSANILTVAGNNVTTQNSNGNVAGGNISVTGNITGSYIIGNGSTLTNITGGNVNGTVANATYATSAGTAGTVTTAAQPNITSVGTLTSVSVSGNAVAGNITTAGTISATGNVIGNNFVTTGSGGALSGTGNITGGNLLTGGIVSATGNITGNFFIGNGSQLTGLPESYGNANVAAYLPTYSGNLTAGNVSVSGNTTSGNISTGNAYANNFVTTGSGGALSGTGNITGGNLFTGGIVSATGNITAGNVSVAGAISTANIRISGDLITGTGPTLTIDPNGSGGTDGNVVITGNLTVQGTTTTINSNTISTNDLTINMANNAANATAANNGGIEVGPVGAAYATLLYNTASNVWVSSLGISSLGNVTALAITANGNLYGANITTAGLISATGNVTGSYFFGNGSALSSITGANVTGTVANATYANTAGVASTVTSNAQANITSVGTLTSLSVTGNITGNYFIGNGSQLTGVTAGNSFSPIVVSGQSNVTANSSATALTYVAGYGILLNTDNTAKSVSYSLDAFAIGGSFGVVDGIITSTMDLGLIIDAVTVSYDLGTVVSTAIDLTNVSSNIIPSANVTYDLGNATNQWRSLYVSGNTIYIGGGSISADDAGITMTSPGGAEFSVSGNSAANTVGNFGEVSASGNITGNYFLGDGSQLTGISSGNSSINITVTTISANTTIAAGQNGFSVGPMATANGVQVSIADGQRWVII